MSRSQHTTEAQSHAAAKAEVETELRKIGLWKPCDLSKEKITALTRKIEHQVSSQDVTVWMKAGIPRETLLFLLATVPLESEGCINAILREMSKRQASLKSLGQRTKTISRDADVLLERASSNADWWFSLHGSGLSIGALPPRAPKHRADVSQALSGIEDLSEMLDNEQRRFGRYLRAVGRVEPGIVQLLVNCWACYSARRNQSGNQNSLRFQLDHLDALARLLTNAFVCAGRQNKKFSANGLRRTFERHVIPLLKLRFALNNSDA